MVHFLYFLELLLIRIRRIGMIAWLLLNIMYQPFNMRDLLPYSEDSEVLDLKANPIQQGEG